MALPHHTFPLPAPVSAVRPKKRKVAAATRATRQPSASTSTASAVPIPDRSGEPTRSWSTTFADEAPIPQKSLNSTTGAVEDRAGHSDDDDEARSSASSCSTRSESPPPIWIPPRTSTLPSDAPQSTPDARDARSPAHSTQPDTAPPPRPRLIIRIPSLAARRAAQHKSPPPVPASAQKRARSPTPDSEEDDFAASFMPSRSTASRDVARHHLDSELFAPHHTEPIAFAYKGAHAPTDAAETHAHGVLSGVDATLLLTPAAVEHQDLVVLTYLLVDRKTRPDPLQG